MEPIQQFDSEVREARRRAESYRSAIMPAELPPELRAVPVPAQVVSAETKLGLGVLAVALFAGVSGDVLLRRLPLGLNVPVWLLLVGGAVVVLAHTQRRRLNAVALGEGRWLLLPVFFFAACLAWRDSRTLNLLALRSILIALALLAFRVGAGRLVVAGLTEYLRAGLLSLLAALKGMYTLLCGEIRWRELPRDGWANPLRATLRGLALAVPLLLVFGALLVSADEVFRQMVVDVFSFDLYRVCLHLLMIGGVTWVVGGYLHLLLIRQWPPRTTAKHATSGVLGITEIGVALGLLNLLFLAFVAVQFRYLFFGAAHFPAGAGRPYAEYARSGFFELVTVAALVLPLLLGAHWVLKKEEPRHELFFRALAGTQIALLFVIMASAMQRMRLYQIACGLTELRIYTMAFMAWLGLVFGWFALTVLRGQRARFAFGAAVSGFVMIALLHALNPDDLIARVNLNRAATGQSADLYYTTSLSADAVPALTEGLSKLKPAERTLVEARLRARANEWADSGWRTWNRARRRARAVVGGQLSVGSGTAH